MSTSNTANSTKAGKKDIEVTQVWFLTTLSHACLLTQMSDLVTWKICIDNIFS